MINVVAMSADRIAKVEIDIPRFVQKVGIGRPRPENRIGWGIREIRRINGWGNPIIGNNPLQLLTSRHAPVVFPAPAGNVDPGHMGLGVAISFVIRVEIAFSTRVSWIINADKTAVGETISTIPGIGAILVMKTAICGLHLPGKAGDIILNAGPGGGGIINGLIS